MKKKLFSAILFLLFTSNVLASTYWSNVPDGPRTIQEAIDKLDGKMLDPIEGVWFTDGMGTVAIFNSDKDTFKMYIIDGDGSAKLFNRTWEATYIKSGSHYNFFHRVWYTNYDGSINRVRTQSGKAYLGSNKNNYSTKYYKKSEEGLLMDGFYTRVWPTDIFTHNSQFAQKYEVDKDTGQLNPKKEVTNQEKPKKKNDRYAPKTNYKNYWWVLILLALGAFFLYTKTVPKPKKTKRTIKSKPTGFKKDLINYWQGKVSYGFSYWVCLTIIGTLIALPSFYFFTDQFIDSASGIVLLILILYALFVIVSQIYLIVGTWRSAEFYKAQKRKLKQSLIWGYLGQISIVLSIIRKISEFI